MRNRPAAGSISQLSGVSEERVDHRGACQVAALVQRHPSPAASRAQSRPERARVTTADQFWAGTTGAVLRRATQVRFQDCERVRATPAAKKRRAARPVAL